MRSFRLTIALTLLGVLAGIAYLPAAPAPKPVPTAAPAPFMKGMNYVGLAADVFASPLSDLSLRQLRRTGADWLAVTPVWFQESFDSSEIRPLDGFTPSDASLRHLVREARRLGFHVMLKPAVEARDGSWRALFRPRDPEGWFSDYRRMVAHYARLAQEEGVEAFQAGGGYSSAEADRGAEWRSVIAAVRREFDGPVTYGADWDRYQALPFWDAVDFIGINAFFPLTAEREPSVDALVRSWRRWSAEITGWLAAKDLGSKKVVFTEIGYPSRLGAAMTPNVVDLFAPLDLNAQQDAYEAAFRALYGEPWLGGMFWFWWDNPSLADWPGGKRNAGFTPRGKPAAEVLARWYRRSRPPAPRPPRPAALPQGWHVLPDRRVSCQRPAQALRSRESGVFRPVTPCWAGILSWGRGGAPAGRSSSSAAAAVPPPNTSPAWAAARCATWRW